MVFEGSLSVNLKDVLMFSRGPGKYHTAPRDFASLAFRLKAKSKYIYQGRKIPTDTHHISLVPSGIAYDQIGSDASAIVFHFDTVGALSGGIQVFAFDDYEKYEAYFRSALRIWNEKAPGYKYRATAIFYDILAAMQRDWTVLDGQKGDFAMRAKEYMDSYFTNPSLSIRQLAAEAFVSDAYFRRRFRQRYHISPKQYLDSVRIQYAISLLQAGYYSQTEIALRCGYQDVKYFRSLFRKKTGQSISQYCKSLLG